MKIGKAIRDIRRFKRAKFGLKEYSGRACAERAGMMTSRWYDLEADRGSPSIDTVEKVAKALGTTVDALISRSNERKANQ